MRFRTWLQNLFGNKKKRPVQRRPHIRLFVEILEDRTVPSTITVTNTSNSALVSGSLPAAVAQADSDTSGTAVTIDFAEGVGQTFATPQTIALTGSLNISNTTPGESITINGPAAGLTIQGGGSLSDFSVFTVAANTTAAIENLAMIDGHTSGFGGGILNSGTLSVSNATVAGNSAFEGGGIFNGGMLTVSNSTFSSNSAPFGGAIDNGGDTTYSGTAATVSLSLTNCTLTGNSATHSEGAIDNGDNTTIDLGSTVTLAATLTDCTVSGNSATVSGGGVDSGSNITNNGTLTLTLTLQDTIVAGDNAPTGPDVNNATGSVTASNTLIGNTAASGISPGGGNILNPAFVGLSALGNYGGPTPTLALLPGSPAIGAAAIPSAAADQRGVNRPATNADIGAFQTQGADAFVVTTAADPGETAGLLSLREAVSLANAYDAVGNSPTITFDPSLNGDTITLTQGQLELTVSTGAVTINGGGQITVSGNQTSRIFQVDSGATAILDNLTITGGNGVGAIDSGAGGAILDGGTLTIDPTTITNNTASGNGGGIDVASGASLTLDVGSTVSSNASTAGNGGGIAFENGALNSSITGAAIDDNTAFANGGGIWFNPGSAATLTLQNSGATLTTVNGNAAGANSGSATAAASTSHPAARSPSPTPTSTATPPYPAPPVTAAAAASISKAPTPAPSPSRIQARSAAIPPFSPAAASTSAAALST